MLLLLLWAIAGAAVEWVDTPHVTLFAAAAAFAAFTAAVQGG
jgi:hypothetical protein